MKHSILNTLGLIAAVFALLAINATPASAKGWALKAGFDGAIQITAVGPNGPTAAAYSGLGQGTHLGQAQMQGVINVTGAADCANGFTATHIDTLTASNGDQLSVKITETSCPRPEPNSNIYDCVGTYIITGGTGRFANQTGSGKWSGTVTFSPSGSGTFSTTYSD
jgi:hypothetical protein